MSTDDCYLLGNIVKSSGLYGELQVFLDVDIPEKYQELESVFVLIDKKLVPFFIEYIHLSGNKSILKFEDIDSREQSDDLAGKELYLPLDTLPLLGDDQFYYHEIIGFELINEGHPVGKVNNVYSFSAQDLIAVMVDNKEVLIPIQDEIVRSVDKKDGKLYTKLPDGLLEIYLNPQNDLENEN